MQRTAILGAVLALALAASVSAQELAATRLYNLVDTPAAVTFGPSGQGAVRLDPATSSTIIRIAGYRKVHIRIGSTSATSFSINMGKIGGATLSQITTQPITSQIRTFDVVGPEMTLFLNGGPPGSTAAVQVWVFLSS